MAPNKPLALAAQQDPRDDAQRGRDREKAAAQAASLRSRAGDNGQRRTLVDRIRHRRVGFVDAVQVERIPRAGGLDLVAASDRLLIRADDLPAAQDALARRGIVVADRSGDTVLLAVPAGGAPRGIAVLARRIAQEDGVAVSLDQVAPLGIWMKGDGGPAETTPGPALAGLVQPPPHPFPTIAVLDTGVSNQGRTDGYLGAGINPAEVDPLDVFPQWGKLDGDAGHGSMVAGVVQQVVPGAPIAAYRVYDSDGVATTFQVAKAMRQAVAAGATILNLSLGTETADDAPPLAFADVVAELAAQHPDVLIVCAAGNGADGTKVWPGALAGPGSNVVAVAGLDAAGNPADWSTRGSWVTCSTVGQGVRSTYVVGEEDGPLIGDPTPDTFTGPDPWAVWTGTSFAAPQIAGAVAQLCADHGFAPRKALAELESLATPAVAGSGYGWTVELLPGT